MALYLVLADISWFF